MVDKRAKSKIIFILGIGSDIGLALARYYLEQGDQVFGTYRSSNSIKSIMVMKNIRLFECDLANKSEIRKCVSKYKTLRKPWDVFISCIGTMEPVGNFFKVNFDEWEDSVIVNSTAQLRFLHELYPYCRKHSLNHAVFFAGGGTNNPFTNYSAYCVSKIMLIKMCELLDDENKNLNAFIVGPGWVRTKIHKQTLQSSLAGANYARTKQFFELDIPGTDYRDIFDCINWCIGHGRQVSGGRNFSVVHDAWRKKGKALARQLRVDTNKFKLRRFKNS